MSTAKRLTPNKIANLVMADEAWHDSEYVAASDYDALSVELAALRADAERMKWLADYMVEIEYEPTPEETVCIWLLMNKELRRECYETSDLRAAIDAAMRVEG